MTLWRVSIPIYVPDVEMVVEAESEEQAVELAAADITFEDFEWQPDVFRAHAYTEDDED
jgi:hypothetical protein